jgi:hypothetical protein
VEGSELAFDSERGEAIPEIAENDCTHDDQPSFDAAEQDAVTWFHG